MIILIHINNSEDHSEKILPLGIFSAGSALKKGGYEVKLMNINEKQINLAAREIAGCNPLYVGISVMTGTQTQHSAELSKKIKSIKNIPIAWGGIHPTLLPKQCMEEDYIDFLIRGEGELTILEFTETILKNKEFNEVKGLAYKKDGKVFINPERTFIQNLDEWRLDFSLLDLNQFIFPLGKYKRVIAYKTSRGCPFGCAFCYNYEFNKSRWRCWSESVVVEDIRYLKNNYKIDAVKFYDDNFFVNRQRALSLLKMIELPSHVEVRIDFITHELASQLKELNIFDMLIGIESGSDRILSLIDKKFTVRKLLEGVNNIAKNNLHATYSFIVGLPTETKEEFDSTIEMMHKIYKIHPGAGFTLGAYLPYPGSKMYNFSLSQGFKAPEKTENWGKIDRFRKSFRSPWVDVKKVWVIRECFKIMSWDLKILKKWFEMRIKHKIYFLPLDVYLIEFLAGIAIEEKSFLGKTLRRFYNFLRFRKTKQANQMTARGEDIGIKFNKGKLLSGIIYPEFFPLSKNDSVLNIGCGDGVQAIVYKGNFRKMTGVDINKERLDTANRLINYYRINNFETVCANAEKIPLNEKFDKIIAIDIIEHVINPDLVIEEISRLLKDDGKLLITFPATHDKWEALFRFVGKNILRREKNIKKNGWDPDAHQYDYSLKKWISIVGNKNFYLVKSRGSTLFPPLHYYLGIKRFWFSNRIIHFVDNWLCQRPFIKNYAQSLVCIFEKRR